MSAPTLYIFSGLPGSGKSTLCRLLAHKIGAAYLRIDTLEQGLREFCAFAVEGEGYLLAYRLAADNLRAGVSVIADSCNTIALTRRAWEGVALAAGVPYTNIEVLCSDKQEHRQRVEARRLAAPAAKLPSWQDVERRTYQEWLDECIRIDTAARSESACLDELLSLLGLN